MKHKQSYRQILAYHTCERSTGWLEDRCCWFWLLVFSVAVVWTSLLLPSCAVEGCSQVSVYKIWTRVCVWAHRGRCMWMNLWICDFILLVLLFLFYSLYHGKTELSESELSSYYLVCLLVRLEDHNRALRHKTHQGPKVILIIPFTKMESLKIQINRDPNKEKTYQLSKRWQTEADISYTERMSPGAGFSSNSTVITV